MMQIIYRGIYFLSVLALISCSAPKQEDVVDEMAAEVLPPVIPEEVAQAHQSAIEALQRAEPKTAVVLLKDIAPAYPQYPALGLNLGIAYVAAEQNTQAQAAFNVVLEQHTDNAVAHTYTGILQRRAGKFEQARESYQRAISGDGTYSLAHLNLGILCDIYLQDWDCALQHYEAYEALEGEVSKQFKGWKIDLQRRIKQRDKSQ